MDFAKLIMFFICFIIRFWATISVKARALENVQTAQVSVQWTELGLVPGLLHISLDRKNWYNVKNSMLWNFWSPQSHSVLTVTLWHLWLVWILQYERKLRLNSGNGINEFVLFICSVVDNIRHFCTCAGTRNHRSNSVERTSHEVRCVSIPFD